MRWRRTTEATHTADFLTPEGGPADLIGPPLANILNPSLEIISSGEGDPRGAAEYAYSWLIPADAPLGLWKINWLGITTDGFHVSGEEWFEIVSENEPVSGDVTLLRSYVGDRRMPTMVEEDLFFTDEELHTILLKNGSDLDRATIEGWFIKMAQYGELVDHVESGAEQKMRQKFLNAKSIYEALVKKAEERGQASVGAIGIVGKAINLRKDPHDPLGRNYFWGNPSSTAMYVRTYPLKRFPAIYA